MNTWHHQRSMTSICWLLVLGLKCSLCLTMHGVHAVLLLLLAACPDATLRLDVGRPCLAPERRVHEGVGLHALPDFCGRKKGRHGHHAAAQGLTQAENIGRHLPVIDTKYLAGAAHTGLNLISN